MRAQGSAERQVEENVKTGGRRGTSRLQRPDHAIVGSEGGGGFVAPYKMCAWLYVAICGRRQCVLAEGGTGDMGSLP